MLTKIRTVSFAIVGVAGLVLKGHYSGVYQDVVRSYGGNIAVSFALYFVMLHVPHGSRYRRPLAAGVALAMVELFEAADGFGLMANVYDPLDFAANALGIALAAAVDRVIPGGNGWVDARVTPSHP